MKKYINRQNIYLVMSIFASLFLIYWSFAKVDFNLKNPNLVDYLFFNPFWAVIIVLIDKFFTEKDMNDLKACKNKISAAGGAISTAREMGDGRSISIKSILNALSGEDLVNLEIQKQSENELEIAANKAARVEKKPQKLIDF